MKLTDIHIRDPFVLTLPEEGRYYLYGTNHINGDSFPGPGFDGYTSTDLENWDGPFPVFRPPAGFWADHHYWAPEAYHYQGRYYLFASFKARGVCRATQALVAGHPGGPFVPHSDAPLTPAGWECLDGTLHIDCEGQPWIVFCREWVEVVDGEIYAQRLSPDLKQAVDEPLLLFRAASVPGVYRFSAPYEGERREGFVTDGPFLFNGKNGGLYMLWSSYRRNGYAQMIARSASGRVEGPWLHDLPPLFTRDGGHGMIFETLQGRRMLSLHAPNRWPDERPLFIPLRRGL